MAKNKIVYASYIFSDDDETLRSGNEYQITSLIADELQADTIELEVKCSDKNIVAFTENAPLQYYRENLLRSTYYVQSIKRIGGDKYTISADSAMGLLMKRLHVGGIYTGQTVKEVVNEICGNIPILVKTVFADTKLYGWLPYCKPPKSSARNNLVQVLYAIGAALTTDNNGVLRVEPLWDGISSSIGEARMYFDGSVETEKPISAVTVTEHQYVAGAEEKELFSGTAQKGDIITFSEPMHSLSANGFSILESGANYAKISAGTGTLKGKAYIHNTRLVTRTVTKDAPENVESFSDATLVSLVNSSAVAKRLADYFKCRETIINDIVSGQEKPGHVVSVYHPYDKKMVTACIQSLDTTMSATLKSNMSALVGYLPPQPESAEYFDERVLLTGAGEWTVPEGVTEIGFILMSGAEGGHPGNQGGTASSSSLTHTWRHISSITGQVTSNGKVVMWGGPGGVGGLGGSGGRGSKVYQGTMSVKDVTSLAYQCGVGGLGAVFGGAPSEGGATTLGEHSSDEGSYSENGWTDPTTGKQYAQTGQTGLPGGNGAGAISGFSPPSGAENLSDVLRYQPSTGARDEDGRLWPGAPTKETSPGVAYYTTFLTNYNGTCGAYAGYALGGGGAAGATPAQPSAQGSYTTNDASAVGGQTGATPTLTPKKAGLTQGGRGGYGGGGGSAASWAGYEHSPDYNGNPSVSRTAAPGPGGNGGRGGPGGDGCIIIFYRKFGKQQAGPLVQRGGGLVFDRLQRLFIV